MARGDKMNDAEFLKTVADVFPVNQLRSRLQAIADRLEAIDNIELQLSKPGQAATMLIHGENDTSDGHWYSPNFVRAIMAGKPLPKGPQ